MRSSAMTVAGFAVAGLIFSAAFAGTISAQPRSRTFAMPGRAVTSRTAPLVRRHTTPTTSCSAKSLGTGAFDSEIGFDTNAGSAYVFGGSNVAFAGYAGVFEGSANVVCDYNSVIAGGNQDVIDSGTGNIPAGAAYSMIGSGTNNMLTKSYAFLGAGDSNSNTGGWAFLGAGRYNTSGGQFSFVGSGEYNDVTNDDSFDGAGYGNTIASLGSFIGAGGVIAAANPGNKISGNDSFIGAGDLNTIAGTESFLGSGGSNTITSSASYASILGGNRNVVSGEYASILGGFGSTASGSYAIVAGGDQDTAAGILSFAAGYHADAAHNGSFVWSDYGSGSATLKDTAANQFVARASGGVYFYSNEAATAGVKLGAGSGTWASLSDRNAKTDVAALDDDSVLAKVSALPVTTWRYKSERGVRHVGPMAQDFYSAFGVGEDDRHITSIDEDGVALAAIKALSHRIGDLHGELVDLRGENARLVSRLDRLENQRARP
jgi:hypothetical protein